MAKGLVSDTNLTAIANAIRTKNGSSDTYTPAEMATAITSIPTSQVDQTTALQWMLNNKTNYAGVAAGLTITELPEFTYTGARDLSSMCKDCTNLVSAARLSIEPASETYYSTAEMFWGCSNLTTPPTFGSFVRPQTSTTGGNFRMFSGCSKIVTINLPASFINCFCTEYMFSACNKLKNFNTNNTFSADYIRDASSMFANCEALVNCKISSHFGSSSNNGAVNASSMFTGCTHMTDFTFGSNKIAYISRAYRMFYNCTRLQNVSLMTLSDKLTDAQDMFAKCTALTNTSLDNIIASFLPATNLPTKTLKYIGLSSAQATTCTGLSNWAALSAAGWTTGY